MWGKLWAVWAVIMSYPSRQVVLRHKKVDKAAQEYWYREDKEDKSSITFEKKKEKGWFWCHCLKIDNALGLFVNMFVLNNKCTKYKLNTGLNLVNS